MKRFERLGARADDAQPAGAGRRASLGQRLACHQRLQAAGERLDRRQRVVQLVAHHPDQPLPGRQLLGPQRPADVGEHQQRVRPARLPEGAAAQLPAVRCPAGRASDSVRAGSPSRHSARPSSVGAAAHRAASPAPRAERSPARLTSRRRALVVEGEDRHVDLAQHLAQQRGRLHVVEPLLAQRLGELVELERPARRRRRRAARRGRGTSSRPRAAPRAGWTRVRSR